MEAANKKPQAMKGGGSLTIESLPAETFIPEDFTEEQKMMMDMCHQFLETEINPLLDRIDKLEPGLMPSLMEKAGEMGMLGVAIPEQYGGLGKEFITSIIMAEGLGAGHSFSVGFSAHTGIGTLERCVWIDRTQQW
jgi:alkylation response protein AidB-like acyl-CoA dehydrogenase